MRYGMMRRLKNAAGNALGLYELPMGNRRFLLTHMNFQLFTAIPGLFISTFFFRQDGRFSTVIIFNAITLFGSALTMQLTSYLAIRKTPLFVLRAGIFLFNVFYVALLLLQSRALQFMVLLAILNAVANGFYWEGYNIFLRNFTKDAIFNRTVSLVGISGSVISLIVPTLSGLVIAAFPNMLGYTVVFAVSFLFSLYTTYLSSKVPKFRLDARPDLALAYRRVMRTRSWLTLFISEVFRGMRDTSFPLFLNLIFFKYVTNEALLGGYSTICGIAATISFYISGSILRIRPGNRIRCIAVSAGILFVTGLAAFFRLDVWVIFAISIVNSLCVTYIQNPSIASVYSMFENLRGELNFAQIMAVREMFYASGRVIGFVMLIALTLRPATYPFAFLALNLTIFAQLGMLMLSNRFRASDEAACAAHPRDATSGEAC